MSNENEGNERKADVAEPKKEEKVKKELTPRQMQRRKKMLVYPFFFLVFAGAMWLIFAPSGDDGESRPDGFNAELPIPKDEDIVGDKRSAYRQEAMQEKQEEKMRSLQDFSFMLAQEEDRKAQEYERQGDNGSPGTGETQGDTPSRGSAAMHSSAHALREVNSRINDWYERPAGEEDDQAQLALEWRIQELERRLEETSQAESEEQKQLELIEKSYAIAAKYMPNTQGGAPSDGQAQAVESPVNTRDKVVAQPVSQVRASVVSLLAAPMENEEFLEQYAKPRNPGFITAPAGEEATDKNTIGATVYRTVTLTGGKELQLRLSEPMRAGHLLIPANTILTGGAKMGGERLLITITSIQYAGHVIPVELEVYDTDGVQGISVPGTDEVTAMKEIAANMGTSMGSSITITDDAGSQLAADLGRSAVQGVSQYFSKKMREVKVTLKAGYRVLLFPKT